LAFRSRGISLWLLRAEIFLKNIDFSLSAQNMVLPETQERILDDDSFSHHGPLCQTNCGLCERHKNDARGVFRETSFLQASLSRRRARHIGGSVVGTYPGDP